jgi:uncharacterized RDD family membrane protein YckC
VASSSDYAGLVTRLAALIIDVIVLTLIVPLMADGPPSMWAAVTGEAPGWVKSLSQVGAGLLPVLYFGLLWWGIGQTLGGLVFGTTVRRPDGEHLGPVRSLLRALIGLLLPVIWLIGMLSVLWDPRRRALHDRIFGTVVIRKIRFNTSKQR